MAVNLPPIPQDKIEENARWREWFRNLGNYIQSAQTGGNVWTILQGGTGASSAAGARSNLGLGTMAVQDYNNVSITGGTIDRTLIKLPYGAFHDTSTQSVSIADTPTKVNVNTTDFNNLITLNTSNSRFTVSTAGMYNVQFSIQATNTDTQAHDFALWLRKNGTDVAATNSLATVPSTHGGVSGYYILTANIVLYLNNTDYIELWWAANSTSVQLQNIAAITSPYARPSTPSVILTITYVSN